MKSKISITLDDDLLKDVDRLAEGTGGRSTFIEQAVRRHLDALAAQRRHARDVAILNRLAGEVNEEAADVLGYQEPE